MQVDFLVFLQILTYIFLIILIIIFIVLGIRLIGTLAKLNKVIDNVQDKMHKTDSVFSLIDRVADCTSNISDKIISGIFNFINGIFKKKGNDNNE